MLTELLKQIGLTENESTVFSCIAQHKKVTAAQITRFTNIKRETVYTVLRELVKKKLIIEDIGSSITHTFSPASAEELLSLLEDDKKRLAQKKEKVLKIIEEINSLPSSKSFSIPQIRYIDEIRLKDFLLNESGKWLKSGEKNDKTWWGFQDASLIENYPEWPKYFFSKYPSLTKLKIVTNKKPAEIKLKKEYGDREGVRYIKGEEFTTTHVIIGDYILMIMTRQRPHYLIEIHDSVMAENLRVVFKKLWESEKK